MSRLLKGSIGLIFFINLLHAIAFLAPGWFLNGQNERGMWYECVTATGCHLFQSLPPNTKAKLDALRAMQSLALIAYVLSGGAAVLRILKKIRLVRKIMAILSISGGVFSFIGIIIAATLGELGSLYYAFGLSIVAFLLSLVAGGLGLLAKEY